VPLPGADPLTGGAGRAAVAAAGGQRASVLLAVGVCAAVAGLLAGVFWLGVRRGRRDQGTAAAPADRSAEPTGAPTPRSEDLVRRLTAEVRRWQADATGWRERALRAEQQLAGGAAGPGSTSRRAAPPGTAAAAPTATARIPPADGSPPAAAPIPPADGEGGGSGAGGTGDGGPAGGPEPGTR
jgi:hypothetical protein